MDVIETPNATVERMSVRPISEKIYLRPRAMVLSTKSNMKKKKHTKSKYHTTRRTTARCEDQKVSSENSPGGRRSAGAKYWVVNAQDTMTELTVKKIEHAL
jgi:hypothetical protein